MKNEPLKGHGWCDGERERVAGRAGRAQPRKRAVTRLIQPRVTCGHQALGLGGISGLSALEGSGAVSLSCAWGGWMLGLSTQEMGPA